MSQKEMYLEIAKESGICVGDRVRVVRSWPGRVGGWENSWPEEMDNLIGKEFTVVVDRGNRGYEIDCSRDYDYNYDVPVYSIERVESKIVLQGDEVKFHSDGSMISVGRKDVRFEDVKRIYKRMKKMRNLNNG